METRVVTAHIPVELAAQVDQLAQRLERPRGWIVRQALSAFIAQEERRRELTREALADVDAGRFVDHEQIADWVNKLDHAG